MRGQVSMEPEAAAIFARVWGYTIAMSGLFGTA